MLTPVFVRKLQFTDPLIDHRAALGQAHAVQVRGLKQTGRKVGGLDLRLAKLVGLECYLKRNLCPGINAYEKPPLQPGDPRQHDRQREHHPKRR